MPELERLLENALKARASFVDAAHEGSFRLFNGFLEGAPSLSVDIYAKSALIQDYSAEPDASLVARTDAFLSSALSWLRCVVAKARNGATPESRNGALLRGSEPDRKTKIDGVWYALDLTMNRDASFYLDTRALRKWAFENLKGLSVLNAFAYTGSLGVAALAGGASSVLQLDRNRSFLELAKRSYALNKLSFDNKRDFLTKDFFPAVAQLKRERRTFDCVFLDPPFFASTAKGTVDLEGGSARLINKVRPLINDGGCLVAVNNALFLKGSDFMAELEALCADGYLKVETLIPASDDCAGFPETRAGALPADPAPFNHATKIALLRVKRKTAVS